MIRLPSDQQKILSKVKFQICRTCCHPLCGATSICASVGAAKNLLTLLTASFSVHVPSAGRVPKSVVQVLCSRRVIPRPKSIPAPP